MLDQDEPLALALGALGDVLGTLGARPAAGRAHNLLADLDLDRTADVEVLEGHLEVEVQRRSLRT